MVQACNATLAIKLKRGRVVFSARINTEAAKRKEEEEEQYQELNSFSAAIIFKLSVPQSHAWQWAQVLKGQH